jgi:exodeoxyribonuclease V beta subunit
MAGKEGQRKAIKKFDLLESPLAGTNLIEASAGTGKTYTISGLFLRLILEKQFLVDQILVVTYTVAATEELRDRIRTKLRQAVEAFRFGDSPDQFLKGLVLKIPQAQKAIRDLEEALNDFDEAPIFTIHGFCQQTLHENAFESGSLFDTELIPDQEGLKEEIILDFWRRHFYEAPLELVGYAMSQKFSPEYFLKLLGNRLAHLDLKIVPESRPVNLTSLKSFSQALEILKKIWPKVREDVLGKLSDPGLKYYSNPRKFIEDMDRYCAANSTALPLFEKFPKFTSSNLQAQTRKNCPTPEHPFFDLCEAFQKTALTLTSEMDQQLLFLKGDLFRCLREELPVRKSRKNIQSFDDLLTRLRAALEKAGGDDLGEAIRGKYRAALIDEFQDTDPVQYVIFKKLFSRKEGLLFLVGDPKQAIYSFRGADLFAYMKAAGQADSRYTLTENWRSEPPLIMAVNTLFSNNRNPFLFDDIPFVEAIPTEHQDRGFLKINKKSEPPFHLWLVDPGKVAEPGKPITKILARDLITRAVAGEISRLLNLGKAGQALIGNKPLRESDMAVLVRTNNEARLVQEALGALRIPSVLYSLGNIFDTQEAAAIQRILAAVAEPGQEKGLKVALTTDLLGVNGEDLNLLLQDETGWKNWLFRFREYYDLWEKNGFIRMFRTFLLREKVRTRLLSFPDGERRLTNVLHLMEVLHQESTERKLGMTGTLKWLSQQMDPDSPRLEEHQLRLESDAKAVRIVTIHKSKGLEYPVVFCPFNWSGSQIKKKKEFLFHDDQDDARLNLVLDPEDNPNRMIAEREVLAENLRLLYVALTRAKNRCYLVWGRFKEAETAALAFLLHPPDDNQEDIVGATGNHFTNLTDADIRQQLTALTQKSDGSIRFSDLPLAPGREQVPSLETREELVFQSFSGSVRRDWQVASFSSLLSGLEKWSGTPGHEVIDLPDYDQGILTEDALPEKELSGIFAFPKGAKAGTLLHDIFEQIDFTNGDKTTIKKITTRKLKEYAFESQWENVICDLITRVLTIPLQQKDQVLRLSDIRMEDRLSELEFYFPLNPITPGKLARIFADQAGPEIAAEFPQRIGKLNFSPTQGFMKGFMDLVFKFEGRFFLVDWKSNFLGSRVEDYGQQTLLMEMRKNYYILQYHLYALALNQYLRSRIHDYAYERHFGGVFYIFLRGIDSEMGSDFGIYRDFPRKELMETLSRELIDQSSVGPKERPNDFTLRQKQ